jgi:hypothetical protein
LTLAKPTATTVTSPLRPNGQFSVGHQVPAMATWIQKWFKAPIMASRKLYCRYINNSFSRRVCWVLPGLDNVSCLSGPARPLPLVVCRTSSLPSARLSPEGSRLLSYICVGIACFRTCVHSSYVRYARQPPSASSHLSIWLAAPRGAADIYVSSCFGPIRLS